MSSLLNIPICCASYFILSIILTLFAAYAYYVNSQRPADDPQKKNYYVSGIFIMPFFWPLLLAARFSIFLLQALHFGLFLVLFTIALILIPKSDELDWLENVALKIGTKLLDADAALRSFAFGWSNSSP